MSTIKPYVFLPVGLLVFLLLTALSAFGEAGSLRDYIYDPGNLQPIDSELRVKIGDRAPEFALPSVSGHTVSLHQFRGKKNVVLSFVPAAWTPVCTGQWAGYNIARDVFVDNDAVLLGISVDNLPSLYAWTQQMGELWFPILSDFWPHGAAAQRFGVLRSDGVAERASFVIDRQGIIRAINVAKINQRPDLGFFARELKKLNE